MKDNWYLASLCFLVFAGILAACWFMTSPNSVQSYYIRNRYGTPCVVADSVWSDDYPVFCSSNMETIFHTLDELKTRLENERKGK